MNKIKIFIDPGHQPGNVNHGPTGFMEWEGNLKRALYLEQFLLNTDKFEVKLSHRGEKFPYRGVRERGEMAAAWGANLIVSLHTNGGGGTGVEIFFSIDIPGDEKWARQLADMIAKEYGVPKRHGDGALYKESKVKKGEDYSGVIDKAQDNGVEHCFLSESLFHDNRVEEALLKQDSVEKKLAEFHAIVFCRVFGVDEKLIYKEYIKKEDEEMLKFHHEIELVNGELVNYETGQVIQPMNGKFVSKWLAAGKDGNLYLVTEYSKKSGKPNGVLFKIEDTKKVALLDKALGESNKKVEELENDNAELEKENTKFKNKIDKVIKAIGVFKQFN